MADAPAPRSGFVHSTGPLGGGDDLLDFTEGFKPGTPEHNELARHWIDFEHKARYFSNEMENHHQACRAHLKETIEPLSDADRLIEEMAHVDEPGPRIGLVDSAATWYIDRPGHFMAHFTIDTDGLVEQMVDMEEKLAKATMTFNMGVLDEEEVLRMFGFSDDPFGDD